MHHLLKSLTEWCYQKTKLFDQLLIISKNKHQILLVLKLNFNLLQILLNLISARVKSFNRQMRNLI